MPTRTPPTPSARRTTIERSGQSASVYLTLMLGGFLASGAVIAKLAAAPSTQLPDVPLVDADPNVGLVLVLVGGVIVGLFGWVMAVFGSYIAPCPACSAPLSVAGRRRNDPVCCPACDGFAEGEAGELWSVEEGRVESWPVFRATLPTAPQFPPMCCVCGDGSVQSKPVRYKIVRKERHGNRYVTEASTLDVPHCAHHKDGASANSTPGMTDSISFVSLPYRRAFCRANAVP